MIVFLLCLLSFAACTPEQPENPPQEPEVPEEVIDYGDGSEERPFVIDNAARLEEFMNVYKDAAQPADKNKFKFYACMIADVDASGITWTPLNAGGSFYKAIDFDGKGFTYCNYWPALVADDQLALHPDYRLYDNLHPGPDGYDVMEAIIKPIIDSLL